MFTPYNGNGRLIIVRIIFRSCECPRIFEYPAHICTTFADSKRAVRSLSKAALTSSPAVMLADHSVFVFVIIDGPCEHSWTTFIVQYDENIIFS